MEIDMAIKTYFCEWMREWVAYDEAYVDEHTPHGRGETEEEALADLVDVLACYVSNMEMIADYYAQVSQFDIKKD
jgi:hypothetical protein